MLTTEFPQELKEILENLPEGKQEAVKGFVSMIVKQSYKGPLPSPIDLKSYEKVLPGAAERILARMEKQSDHRMRLEEFVTHEDQKQSSRGQIFALIIALTFFTGAVALIFEGHETSGTILGSIDLVALVTVFIYGKIQQRNEADS